MAHDRGPGLHLLIPKLSSDGKTVSPIEGFTFQKIKTVQQMVDEALAAPSHHKETVMDFDMDDDEAAEAGLTSVEAPQDEEGTNKGSVDMDEHAEALDVFGGGHRLANCTAVSGKEKVLYRVNKHSIGLLVVINHSWLRYLSSNDHQ